MDPDVADLSQRVRNLEQFDTPFSRQVMSNIAKIAADVERMDRQGGTITTARLETIRGEILALRTDIIDVAEEFKAIRTTVRSALVSAAGSIAVSIILFFVLRRT